MSGDIAGILLTWMGGLYGGQGLCTKIERLGSESEMLMLFFLVFDIDNRHKSFAVY